MTTIADRRRLPQVWLLEDNRGDRLILEKAFSRSGSPVDLTVIPSGEDALLRLRDPGMVDHRPDLIILDLNLPGMGGLDFLQAVKTDSLLRRIPAVMLTSSASDRDINAAYDRHANAYFVKPMGTEGYDQIVAALSLYWFRLAQTACEPPLAFARSA